MHSDIQLPGIAAGLLPPVDPLSRSYLDQSGWSDPAGVQLPPDASGELSDAVLRVLTANGNRLVLDAVEQGITMGIDDAALRILLGVEYMRLGTVADNKRAIGHFRMARAKRPNSYEPSYYLSFALLMTGDAKRAYKNAGKARDAARTPHERSMADWVMAVALNLLGDWAKAARHIERAYRESPDDDTVASVYARLLVRRGNLEEAMTILDDLGRRSPQDVGLRCERIAALIGLGRQEEALLMAQTAADAKPDGAVEAMNLGAVLTELGRRDEAIAAYQRAEMLFARSPNLTHGRAMALQSIAVVLLHEIVTVEEPDHREALIVEAEQAVTQAIEFAPRSSPIVTTAAILAQIDGRLEEASDLYVDALDVDPTNLVARVNFDELRHHIASLSEDERERLLVDAGLLGEPVEPLDEAYWDMAAPSIPTEVLVRAIEDDRNGR